MIELSLCCILSISKLTNQQKTSRMRTQRADFCCFIVFRTATKQQRQSFSCGCVIALEILFQSILNVLVCFPYTTKCKYKLSSKCWWCFWCTGGWMADKQVRFSLAWRLLHMHALLILKDRCTIITNNSPLFSCTNMTDFFSRLIVQLAIARNTHEKCVIINKIKNIIQLIDRLHASSSWLLVAYGSIPASRWWNLNLLSSPSTFLSCQST